MSNVAGKAYAMNVITPVPPGSTWLNRVIFMVSRCFPSLLTGLINLQFIHMARWVIIEREQWPDLGQGPQSLSNNYVLFCSNFNGTWHQYLDAFSDGIPTGLDFFWYSSSKFPHSIPITPFKRYITHNQIDTDYYYNATPGYAQRDIKSSLRVHHAVKRLAATYHKVSTSKDAAAQFAIAYRRTLLETQNCLAAPGYAPVASIDTEQAEINLKAWVRLEKAYAPSSAVELRYELEKKAERIDR